MSSHRQPRIAVIGTGFSGLCAGIRLKQDGFENLTLFERGDEVGGVWRENTYPGAACDVPWHLYSFSFDYQARFTCPYPEQPEILAYQQDCARRYGLYPHIRFNTEIESARFDDEARVWHLRTSQGETHEFDALITGVGQLSRPGWPNIPGRDDFAGHSFHSAEWDHDYDLRDKRVAVIGTGASAIQFVPRIAAEVSRLVLFQRSAPYLLPRFQRTYGRINRWLFRHVPRYRDIFRWALRASGDASVPAFHQQSRLSGLFRTWWKHHLKRQVKDPTLREKLTPDYPIGCKRILFSSDYYPALTRDNVILETGGIERITPDGIRTADGRDYAVDAIIYGTGFRATEFLAPMTIEGSRGRSLADRWADGAEAYLGITVDGFPNLFICYGPNTNLGGNSIIYMIECQVEYIRQCLGELRAGQARTLEVRPDTVRRYNEQIQSELSDTVWNWGCNSWYHTADGRITNNWPGTNRRYRNLTARLDRRDYRIDGEAPKVGGRAA